MCTDVSQVPVAFINRISCTSAGTDQELWPSKRKGELLGPLCHSYIRNALLGYGYGNLNSDVHNGSCAYVNGFNVLVPLCADDADIGAGCNGAELWTN
jgi:hypothetical protein